MTRSRIFVFVLLIFVLAVSSSVYSQTTEFVYQGQLQNSAAPANGSFDFEFLLFDALSGGTQVGSTLTPSGVAVANGTFKVALDFGSIFTGPQRFLEIHVRPAGGGTFTTLIPRQTISNAPYSVKSLNADTATNLGGIAPSGFIQNTSSQQATSNFNITGNGTAAGTLSGGQVNTAVQYNIGGVRAFTNAGSNNLFAGVSAGSVNAGGGQNTFLGQNAGHANTTGSNNLIVGQNAGLGNTTGGENTFVGLASGVANTTGSNNTFIGSQTGQTNTTGNNNTTIGFGAAVGSGITFATAVGSSASVSFSNTVVLGRAADTVRIPGSLVVTGSVSKGSGSFRIDHPLDPENKYLYHSFVESPDMMNVYNGNIVTNEKGEATVVLPDYFEALNRDFRYQLTVIGQFAQVIVAEKIKGNQFKIRTDKPNIEVSWQVTGIRHDKFADDERIRVEQNKPADERGKCVYAPACQK